MYLLKYLKLEAKKTSEKRDIILHFIRLLILGLIDPEFISDSVFDLLWYAVLVEVYKENSGFSGYVIKKRGIF